MTTQQNAELIDLLESEFRRLERLGKGSFSTVQEMAEFLGVDKGTFSRLRNGHRDMNRPMARSWAERLRDSPAEIQELTDRLVSTRAADAQDQVEVENWIQAQRGLMLVEFRELPAVRPDGGRSPLARCVAEALLGKLRYAMMFPFFIGPNDGLHELRRAKITELKRHVVDTYGSILEHMMEFAWDQCETNGAKDPAERIDHLLKIGRRIRLYELSRPDPSLVPTFFHRLFVVRDHEHDGIRSNEPMTQIWEWVSAPDKVRMFRKEASSDDLKVMELGFFPVIEFWDEEKRLPQTVDEMTRFASERAAMDWLSSSFGAPTTNWKVFGVDESGHDRLQDYVEAFVKKMNESQEQGRSRTKR